MSTFLTLLGQSTFKNLVLRNTRKKGSQTLDKIALSNYPHLRSWNQNSIKVNFWKSDQILCTGLKIAPSTWFSFHFLLFLQIQIIEYGWWLWVLIKKISFPNFQKMVLELISGPSIGMEITSCDSQHESRSKSHCDFRNLCGPGDPVSS